MSYRTYDEPDVTDSGQWSPNPANYGTCTLNLSTNPDVVVRRKRGAYLGANTAHFRKKVRDGVMLPLNAYQRWDYEGNTPLGSYSSTYTNSCSGIPRSVTCTNAHFRLKPLGFNEDYDVVTAGSLAPSYESVDTNSLLLSALASMTPDLDVLTTLAEARQTIDMVLKARADAKRLILQALRGGKHTAKAAADAWMAWRYGWQILGMDIEAIGKVIRQPILPLVIEGRAGASLSGSETINDTRVIYQTISFTPSYTVTHDVSIRANVVGKLRFTTVNALVDIPTTVWELVPYSFVADWFVNIGDILGAWKVRSSLEKVYFSLGRKTSLGITGIPADISDGSNVKWTGTSGFTSSTESYTLRERIPVSAPSFTPAFTVSLTSKRILDAAAMLSKRIL